MPIYKGLTPPHDYSEFIVNYNLQNFCGPYDKLELLTARRDDYPGVCYHIRIKDIVRAGKMCTANYEIVFQNGQWEVLTGTYAAGYSKVNKVRLAARPADDQLTCVKSFPAESFIKARKFCVQHADAGAGQLEWEDVAGGGRRGRAFLRLVEYKIAPNTQAQIPGKFIAHACGTYNTDEDKLKLNAYLGGFSTVAAAETVCQDHYSDFVEKYFADGFFDNWRGPEQGNPDITTPKTSLKFRPGTHFWVEKNQPPDHHYLSHPERNAQEFVICPHGDIYKAYMINNLQLECMRLLSKPVEYPEVIYLGKNTDLAPLKRLCEHVFIARGSKVKMVSDTLVRGLREVFAPPKTPGTGPLI